jgi:outer membrane receptor for Fe3+-dicitrate
VVRQSRERSGVERDSESNDGAETEPRRDARARRADRRRVPHRITDGGVANAGLVGKYVPQVPLHHGTFQVAYSNPKVASIALSMQAMSLQYNDDQNVNSIPPATLTDSGYTSFTGAGLPGYASWDLNVVRDVGRGLQVFFGVQNMFDQVYFVQTNPSTTGTPRLVNGGVRVRFSGR